VSEVVYANDQFYDTGYHLTAAGKHRRTALLVERLKPRLTPPANRIAKEPAPTSRQ
jgi:hypothetical protein